MSKERFLTVLVPIKDSDCESEVYDDVNDLESSVPPQIENINKIYKTYDGTFYRLYFDKDSNSYKYHSVVDREFPYLGKPLEIFDFTYDATRMGTAPTISASNVMWYADKDANGEDSTLEGLWTQECHVIFNGKNLYLKQVPTSSKSFEDARYKYDLDFIDEIVSLENVYFFDVVQPFINEKPVSENSVFSFYGDINELAKRINASLIRSNMGSLIRKYVHYDDPYYEELMPSTIVPYLTYSQWTMLGVSPYSLVPSVFGTIYECNVFRYEVYDALGADYNRYLMQYIYENENGEYALTGYQCKIGKDKKGEISSSEEKLLSFEDETIYEALQHFHDDFNMDYYVTNVRDENGHCTGDTWIVVGDCEHDFADWDEDGQDFVRDDEGIPVSTHPFDYGSEDALMSKEKANTTDKIITRITGVGSSDNIPWHYPNPTPDGWLKPIYTKYGIEQSGVIIDYPTDSGETSESSAVYERFLKNRLGTIIKRGNAQETLFGGNFKNAIKATVGDNTFIIFIYYINTEGIQLPKITLDLNCDPFDSKCARIHAELTDSSGNKREYDSDEQYEDPNLFQIMFDTKDGKHYAGLLSDEKYSLIISYIVPTSEMPTTRLYDYEGYYYPSRALAVGGSGLYGYVGQNFYEEKGLQPFIDWSIIGGTTPVVYDTGYSVDGTKDTKMSAMPRVLSKKYKDIDTGKIYNCYDSEDTDISIGGGDHKDAFDESPAMTAKEWLDTFVDMKLVLYSDGGWYIDGEQISLADYGLSSPYQESGSLQMTIFNAIEFRRTKWLTPATSLMPEVFIKTDGERRFYDAHNYYPLKEGLADKSIGEQQNGSYVVNPLYKNEETDADSKHYVFENEYIRRLPNEHIENFDDVKPTIVGQKNMIGVQLTEAQFNDDKTSFYVFDDGEYVQCSESSVYDSEEQYFALLRIDVVEEFAYDLTDSDEIWESNEDGEKNDYKHPYFFARLRPLGFNIFDLALQDDMVISMTTGNCGACNFKIGVDERTGKNPVQVWEYDVYRIDTDGNEEFLYEAGSLRRYVNLSGLYYDTDDGYVPVSSNMLIESGGEQNLDTLMYERYTYSEESVENGLVGVTRQDCKKHFEGDVVTSGKFIESQQDTSVRHVWVALMKDTETYGVVMPSATQDYTDQNFSRYIEPKGIEYTDRANGSHSTLTEDDADKFVLTNIRLPQVYLRNAEHELSRKLVKHMYKNNWQKYNFSAKFSRIYIAQNAETDERLNENSVFYIRFDRKTFRQYAKHYSYTMRSGEVLPEITVDLNEELSVTTNLEGRQDKKIRKRIKDMSSQLGKAISLKENSVYNHTVIK